jgi:GT2 family glycosyltransferase
LWDRLGGFDESFFMYGEDTDLCLRAWELGQACAVCPDARLVHYGGASEKVRPDKMVRLFRAKAQLVAKHWKPSSVWAGLAALRLWALTRMTALGVLRLARPRLAGAYHAWAEVWRRRAEFSVLQAVPSVPPLPRGD